MECVIKSVVYCNVSCIACLEPRTSIFIKGFGALEMCLLLLKAAKGLKRGPVKVKRVKDPPPSLPLPAPESPDI